MTRGWLITTPGHARLFFTANPRHDEAPRRVAREARELSIRGSSKAGALQKPRPWPPGIRK
jgi:hypothetical protein